MTFGESPFDDKTKTAMLYADTPDTWLGMVLKQRSTWRRTPTMCPRCGAYLYGRNHIVDKRYGGLYCVVCNE